MSKREGRTDTTACGGRLVFPSLQPQQRSTPPRWPHNSCPRTAPRPKGLMGEGALGRPEPDRVGTRPLGAWPHGAAGARSGSPSVRCPRPGRPPGRGPSPRPSARRVIRAGVPSGRTSAGQPASLTSRPRMGPISEQLFRIDNKHAGLTCLVRCSSALQGEGPIPILRASNPSAGAARDDTRS